MRKLLLLLFVMLILGLFLSGCGDNCYTGYVVDKYSDNSAYYLTLEIKESVISLPTETRTVSVSKNFYYEARINHLVTICH